MIITSLAGRVWKYIYLALPVFYLFVVALHGYHRPYLMGPITVLNFILYVLEALHCLIPICAMFDEPISDTVYIPIAIALLVIPVLSCLLILCCRHHSFDQDDPTIPEDQKKKVGVKNKRATTFDDENWDASQLFQANPGGPQHRPSGAKPQPENRKALARARTLMAIDEEQEQQAEWKAIPVGGMEMISQFEAKENKGKKHTDAYEVNTVVMQPMIQEMYMVLDWVIDGATIATLIRTVYWAMILGSIAFGWYLGALRGVVRAREMILCGAV
jgi:hypothetical protein